MVISSRVSQFACLQYGPGCALWIYLLTIPMFVQIANGQTAVLAGPQSTSSTPSASTAPQTSAPQPVGAGQGQVITLTEALKLAHANDLQFQTAQTNAKIAHENRLQARDARLPTVHALNQFLYTEGNGTPSGVFIANDGVHVYNEQAVVREDLLALVRSGQERQAQAAEAVARAKEEIARRGLVQTVVGNYYNLLTSQQKIVNAQDSLKEANDFVEVTKKQETAGVVSHVDVVKAEIQAEQSARNVETAQLAAEQAHLALAVLLFAKFDNQFTVNDSIPALPAEPPFAEVRAKGLQDNPNVASARAGVKEAHAATSVARYAYLPGLIVNFYYGIDANELQATASGVYGSTKSTQQNNIIANRQNLGYAADVTLNIPVWDWGATRSRVRVAEDTAHLAEVQAQFAERQLQEQLRLYYREAEVARNQLTSLTRSRDLATENLHLTMLRYEAGEATALEATSAESSLATARNAYQDGLSHFYVVLAQLETLTGTL
jgi:outer membrane protein TolC